MVAHLPAYSGPPFRQDGFMTDEEDDDEEGGEHPEPAAQEDRGSDDAGGKARRSSSPGKRASSASSRTSAAAAATWVSSAAGNGSASVAVDSSVTLTVCHCLEFPLMPPFDPMQSNPPRTFKIAMPAAADTATLIIDTADPQATIEYFGSVPDGAPKLRRGMAWAVLLRFCWCHILNHLFAPPLQARVASSACPPAQTRWSPSW